MDNSSKNQASGSDDRFLGETMLRRIANFGLERNPNQTKHWMPDSAGKECYDCQEKFTPFRRRHHCRICGLLFCSRCCSYAPQAKLAGYSESNIRLCSYCSSTLLKEPNVNSMSMTASNQQHRLSIPQSDQDQQQQQQQQQHQQQQQQQQQSQIYVQELNTSDSTFNADHFSLSKTSSAPLLLTVDNDQSTNSSDQNLSNSDLSQKPAQQQSQQRSNFNLKSLFNEIFRTSQGIQMQKKRFLVRTIECVQGKDIVDWLIKNQRASIVSEAKLLCQCFINEAYLEPVVAPQTSFIEFKPDQTLYKLGKRGLERDAPTEPGLFRTGSISSTASNESNNIDIIQQKMVKSTGVVIGTDLNYVQFNAQVANTLQDDAISVNSKKEGNDFNMPTDTNEAVDEIDGTSTMKQSSPSDSISSLYNEYEELLLKQILIQFHVDSEWFPIILNICRTLAKIVRVTSINNDSTPNYDIRRNVKFKKLPGGLKTETQIINGCVFSKNVIHRSMSSKIDVPRVLLLKSQIEYQRSDDHRLTTLEPVLNQEQHYLSSYVDKINSHFKPDILVVEKSVSRLAQDFIIANGLILIYNVKESIMQRLSKCLRTTIMTSIDSRLPSNVQTPLGQCEYFQVKEYELNNSHKKRLMFFAGCPPEYGCTVLIRGGTLQELKVVKSIMHLFLLITYSTQLEQSFLNDCYAQIIINPNDYLTSIKQFDLDQYIDSVVINKQSIMDLIVNSLLLSTSPYVRYNPPYILTCTNQQYVSSDLLYQTIFNNKYQQKRDSTINGDRQVKDSNTYSWFYNSPYNNELIHVNDKHKFIKDNTILAGVDPNSKAVYAHYRASGGRCQFRRRRWYDWLTQYQQQQPRDQPLETIFAPYLDLRLHLHIAILYSAHCTVQNKLLTCRQPEILEMPAYSVQDTTLGSFLEQHCFSTNDAPCKTCQQPLQDHVRQIVHGDMKLVIRIKHVDKTTSNLQKLPKSNAIYMWSYCEHCRESSAKRLMSARTWSLSFTKFLELLFHLESFSVSSTRPCQHHLFRDHFHYFHSQQFIASFRLFKIKLKEFYLPKSTIGLKPFVFERDYYIELTKTLSINGYSIFSTIVERLVEFKNLSTMPDLFISKIEQYLAQEKIEQQVFRSLMDEIQLKMTAGNGGEQKRYLDAVSYVYIDDEIVEAKKFITKIVHHWNTTLLELVQIIKKHEKQREALKKVAIKALPSGESNNEIASSVQNEPDISNMMENLSMIQSQMSTTTDNDENSVENSSKTIPSSVDDDTSRRTGVFKFLSTFLPTSENDFVPLKSPFNDDEHLQLSGKYVVNHRELSSIIAHALSMSEYDQRLNEEISLLNETNQEQNIDVKQQVDDNDTSLEDHRHVELHFNDSSTKFTVKIFYAAKFHLLRQNILTNNNDEISYIRSLSRCKKWQPRGGKSKSEFWQTNDDFFVLKDLNQKESLSFSEFAPSYIDYMMNSIKHNRPTILTKILGIYHIQFRHNSTGENFKRDILVLENLLNNQNNNINSTIPPIIYDLKGSMRNRLANVDDIPINVVFLDENFIIQTQENPFYVRLHTKWTLMKALYADTQFLAKHGIVDYSLLVSSHDDGEQSIVFVGIIDYIRTYTWDKKIETIVKSISGQRQSPTVISPEHYRKRFLRQMDLYFPVVPDEWHTYEKKFLNLSVFQTEAMATNVINSELPG